MSGLPHSKKEIRWAKKQIESLGKLSTTRIEKSGIAEEYKKLFNRNIKSGGLYTWFRAVRSPEVYGYAAVKAREEARKKDPNYVSPKGKKNPINVLLKSNYILLANGGVSGFETEEELKQCINSSPKLGAVKLFVSQKINIQYHTTVAIGDK